MVMGEIKQDDKLIYKLAQTIKEWKDTDIIGLMQNRGYMSTYHEQFAGPHVGSTLWKLYASGNPSYMALLKPTSNGWDVVEFKQGAVSLMPKN